GTVAAAVTAARAAGAGVAAAGAGVAAAGVVGERRALEQVVDHAAVAAHTVDDAGQVAAAEVLPDRTDVVEDLVGHVVEHAPLGGVGAQHVVDGAVLAGHRVQGAGDAAHDVLHRPARVAGAALHRGRRRRGTAGHAGDHVLDRSVLARHGVDHAGDALDGVVDGAVLLRDLADGLADLGERGVHDAVLADDRVDGAGQQPTEPALRLLGRAAGVVGRGRGHRARDEQPARDERGRERAAHELPLHASPCV